MSLHNLSVENCLLRDGDMEEEVNKEWDHHTESRVSAQTRRLQLYILHLHSLKVRGAATH